MRQFTHHADGSWSLRRGRLGFSKARISVTINGRIRHVGGPAAKTRWFDEARGGRLQCVWPDLTLIVDVPSDLGLSRVGRGGGPDRMESKSLEFHRRVRELFLQQAKSQPAKFAIIDGQSEANEVQERIRHAVESMGF